MIRRKEGDNASKVGRPQGVSQGQALLKGETLAQKYQHEARQASATPYRR